MPMLIVGCKSAIFSILISMVLSSVGVKEGSLRCGGKMPTVAFEFSTIFSSVVIIVVVVVLRLVCDCELLVVFLVVV